MFEANGCEYNVVDIVSFVEGFRKMTEQYYPDTIDECKAIASTPDISMY